MPMIIIFVLSAMNLFQKITKMMNKLIHRNLINPTVNFTSLLVSPQKDFQECMSSNGAKFNWTFKLIGLSSTILDKGSKEFRRELENRTNSHTLRLSIVLWPLKRLKIDIQLHYFIIQ